MNPIWDQVRKRMEDEPDAAPAHETLGKQFEGREDVEVRPLSVDALDQ